MNSYTNIAADTESAAKSSELAAPGTSTYHRKVITDWRGMSRMRKGARGRGGRKGEGVCAVVFPNIITL